MASSRPVSVATHTIRSAAPSADQSPAELWSSIEFSPLIARHWAPLSALERTE